MGTPLLSNLDIIENIALIKEVHEGFSRDKALAVAQEALNAVGAGHIAHFRSVKCSVKELFIAQLIRATMVQYAKIVIIRPFVMLKDTEEIQTIVDVVFQIAKTHDCTVLDMKINRSKYEAGGDLCLIIA
jgi:ABC-type sugar transport system ATPase subunit